MHLLIKDLEGGGLDYWVAKAEGGNPVQELGLVGWFHRNANGTSRKLSYSTDWSQGGPIIEREGISLKRDTGNHWTCWKEGVRDPILMSGPTPLIAAMRAHVASKFGETVEEI